ncbi:MAG: sterol-binding protein, partial [Deltaproteobacteria bacterium]|nr:sterol-binding protein [Deltaproteobacteria bacterium]
MAVESVSKVFEENIANRLESKPELAAQIGASYKFEVTGDGGGTWLVNLK